jgi:hypothetical protein
MSTLPLQFLILTMAVRRVDSITGAGRRRRWKTVYLCPSGQYR